MLQLMGRTGAVSVAGQHRAGFFYLASAWGMDVLESRETRERVQMGAARHLGGCVHTMHIPSMPACLQVFSPGPKGASSCRLPCRFYGRSLPSHARAPAPACLQVFSPVQKARVAAASFPYFPDVRS